MGKTSQNGLIGQTAVLNRLVQLGYEVLLPWSQDVGYDLAYFKDGSLVRVQCKMAWLSGDSEYIIFNTSTVSVGGKDMWKKKKTGYEGRAEVFGVYSSDTEKVYMIAVTDATRSSMRLRLIPSYRILNGRKYEAKNGAPLARNYEF